MMLERADKLLQQVNLAASRTQAQKLIKAGVVKAKIGGEWQLIAKSSLLLPDATPFIIESNNETKYVSRAGLKLEGALNECCKLNLLDAPSESCLKNCIVLDVGQSTGGFTDCCLKHGAKQVVGVDVGHDQLSELLKKDQRVTCLEGINARRLPASLSQYSPDGFDVVVMDVSFISQTKIIAGLSTFLKKNGLFISLIKPQFEVGKDGIGKNGLVKVEYQGVSAINNVVLCAKDCGFEVLSLTESVIKGGDGNTEYIMVCRLAR